MGYSVDTGRNVYLQPSLASQGVKGTVTNALASGEERFLLTYGDGVTDLNIGDTLLSHEKSGAILSLTAYQPSGKFGALHVCRPP